jgi:hypothetical protein
MTDGPVTEPLADDRENSGNELTADDVMEGGHVATNQGAEVQGMGIVSGVGSGTGATDVEPAEDTPPDNDGETVD